MSSGYYRMAQCLLWWYPKILPVSSALLLCDVNISIISSSLHHSLTTYTHSAKQVPKIALSLCPLSPQNKPKMCQAPNSINTAEFPPAGE